jgi:hypothetical protein
VLPPSRGRLNAGAFAPSAKGTESGTETGAEGVERGAGDAPALSTGSFLTDDRVPAPVLAAPVLAATALGAAIAGESDFSGLFNFFDGALCDAFAVGLPVRLVFVFLPDLVSPDLVAVALRAFKGAAFAGLADRARIAFPAAGLEDFLRVFLDIRLPFVAFRGSIIGVLRQAGIEQTVR